jgi:hypothetical protein
VCGWEPTLPLPEDGEEKPSPQQREGAAGWHLRRGLVGGDDELEIAALALPLAGDGGVLVTPFTGMPVRPLSSGPSHAQRRTVDGRRGAAHVPSTSRGVHATVRVVLNDGLNFAQLKLIPSAMLWRKPG